jgi:hypothetical protein
MMVVCKGKGDIGGVVESEGTNSAAARLDSRG